MPDPTDTFETWLFRLVAAAVEGNEVSATLLTDLHAAIVEVRARPPDAGDALAFLDLAERVDLPVDHLTALLATLRAPPTPVRKRFLRRFVEAWLMQRGSYTTLTTTEVVTGKVLDGRQTVPLGAVVLAQRFNWKPSSTCWNAEASCGRRRC